MLCLELEDDDAIGALGSLKAIDDNSTLRDVDATMRAHRAALLQCNGNVEAIRQTSERMVGEMQRKLDEAKKNSRMEWVPEGEVADMDARYLDGDGPVRLGSSKRSFRFPDGSTEEIVTHGLLTDPYPVTRAQQDLQDSYLGLALAYRRATRQNVGRNPWGDALVRRQFRAFSDKCRSMPGRTGVVLREMLERAVSNTAGSGLELIAVPQTANIVRPYDLMRRIPGLFQQKQAGTPSFRRPIVTGRMIFRKRGLTSTDDPARFPVSTFTTSEETVTLIDLVGMALVDTLWANDASSLLADPMSEVRAFIARGAADTLEMGILHGDTTATHEDALAVWTMGGLYTAGVLDGSDSPLRQWKGLRRLAVDASTTVACGGTFDASDHYGGLAAMGNHGAADDVITIWGLAGFYTQILANALFTTWDKAGPNATMITGAMGTLAGRLVAISEFLAKEYETTGLFTDGTGLKNAAVYCRPSAFDLWTTDGGGDFEQMYADKGAAYVGTILRALFYRNCLSTEKPVAYLINL